MVRVFVYERGCTQHHAAPLVARVFFARGALTTLFLDRRAATRARRYASECRRSAERTEGSRSAIGEPEAVRIHAASRPDRAIRTCSTSATVGMPAAPSETRTDKESANEHAETAPRHVVGRLVASAVLEAAPLWRAGYSWTTNVY